MYRCRNHTDGEMKDIPGVEVVYLPHSVTVKKRKAIPDTLTVEQLVEERAYARKCGDYAKSDALRTMLNKHGVYMEDTPNGHSLVVYLPHGVTVEMYVKQQEKKREAEKRFDMWLNSQLEDIRRGVKA